MLHSPATPIPQSSKRGAESSSLPTSDSDSFMTATLSPTSTASTDSSSSSSHHSSPVHPPASSHSSSVSFASLGSTPMFASPSSSYPLAASLPSPSNMSAALLQQQQQQAQRKQQAIASSLLNSMQAHPPASFAHSHSSSPSLSTSPAPTASFHSASSLHTSYPVTASLPLSTPSTSRRRGARRQRSPGHNRVPLWDTVRGKKLSGFASPMEKNLKRYLDEHPNCVLYDRNIHRVNARSGEASKEGDEDEEEDEEEEVPAELERIISSSPQTGSPLSHSPKHAARASGQLPPIRGQAARQQGTDAIPRSMPMPVLSSSLPSHVNIPPPLSSSLPTTPTNLSSANSPYQSPVPSPLHSPSSKITMKLEQLTMSASTNSLSSLASASSSASTGKVKKAKKLTQSPRNYKPILLSGNVVAPSGAMESSARTTVISRRTKTTDEEHSAHHVGPSPIMAAAAVHPQPYHPTLSVSVPLPSYMPQSMSSRPLTVETHFEEQSPSHSHYPQHHPHHYPQLHSSSLSRSTTCSPTNSSLLHGDPFSASSLNNSPRRKAKHARAHPYHGDRTPKYSEGRGRLDEEVEYKGQSGRGGGWSHSLPSSGPHPGMYAPPMLEVAVDDAGHVCTCGGAQQQYAQEGYYVQHGHGDPMFDAGPPGGYHHSGMDMHHMAASAELMDEHYAYGQQHAYSHPHPHSHSHSHSHHHPHQHVHQHSHPHEYASHSHHHSHAHAHHHAILAPAPMHDNPPMRILSPVNGASSAHSVSSESTHSSASSNPSSKHLVYSRPMSPSHSRTSPPLPLPAPATSLYAVEVETKPDGQTVVHHHHHYQLPAPALSPSAWLVEGGVDDRVMAEEGQWTSVAYPPHSHASVASSSSVSPPPVHGQQQYMAVSVSPTPQQQQQQQQGRLGEELYLAPSDHSVGGGNDTWDLAAFDFTQLH